MAIPPRLVAAAAITVALVAAIVATAYDSETSAIEIAKLYYEKSEFITGGKTTPIEVHVDESKVAKKADVPPEVEKEIMERAGVRGKSLGTYRYNETHLVTLVEEEFLKVYAVVWSRGGDLAVYELKFEKFVEHEDPQVVEKVGDYEFVKGGRYVGYVDTSGVLPFATYAFEDEYWGQFNTPGGYFRVTARGRFSIIYGVAVYVYDRSTHDLTDPILRLCFFRSWTSGSGSPIAGVTANGRAMTAPCFPLATVFDLWARIGYDAWLNRFTDAFGNKWFTTNCQC